MQQGDDPPSLPVGTEVSAKYKGAFCEAKVSTVIKNIKIKVAYKLGLGCSTVSDDAINLPSGELRVGATVEVRHPDREEMVEATIMKIQDCSQYTVVFDDGDVTTLRRTALCLKSGRHFNESETLDQLPLTHPEHFGNPVLGMRRGRRRGQLFDESSDEDDEIVVKRVVNVREEDIGKVESSEPDSTKKDNEKWFPALVVAPTAQANAGVRVKDEFLVRSFKDGRFCIIPKKDAIEFTRESVANQDEPAVKAALQYLDGDVLPPHWDRDKLFGLSNSSTEEESDKEPSELDDEERKKNLFVSQLIKYMGDRGTPMNKVPSIQSRDVDLYRLFRAVQVRGGYDRVTVQNQWESVAIYLGYTPCTVGLMNLVKQAYKKFLKPYCDLITQFENDVRNLPDDPDLSDSSLEEPTKKRKMVITTDKTILEKQGDTPAAADDGDEPLTKIKATTSTRSVKKNDQELKEKGTTQSTEAASQSQSDTSPPSTSQK